MPAEASIVVPVSEQRPDWLRQCVESAAAQTRDTEVLVVHAQDTGAATRAVLEDLAADFDGVRILAERSPGFAAAINTGIAAATCERIGLLLSDDWLQPDAVELCLPHDADIVSAGHRVFKTDGVTELPGLARPFSQARYEALTTDHDRAGYLSHFFLFRRAALTNIGGVDETAGRTGIDDFDMIWTLLENGASVRVLPARVYNYRDHDGPRSSLRDAEVRTVDLEKVLDKHGVHGAERQNIIANHRRWFGKTLQQAQAEIKGTPLGWARETWRRWTCTSPAIDALDLWLRRTARRRR